jgi:uncharacterized protein (TIGR02246 family)
MNTRRNYRRFFLALGGCAAVLLGTALFSQQTSSGTRASDEAAIRDLDAKWSKAASANDVDGTVSYYSDDASLLPPNTPIATGRQAIRSVWASLLTPGTSLSWQANKVEVARSGDLAYLIGAYQMTVKNGQDRGKFVEVWKKQPDGQWKAVADIFNSDLPASPPGK